MIRDLTISSKRDYTVSQMRRDIAKAVAKLRGDAPVFFTLRIVTIQEEPQPPKPGKFHEGD